MQVLWRIYDFAGFSLAISGYSSFTPGSQVNCGQQYGKGALLLVFSVSNLHLSFTNGNGPQSSTTSKSLLKLKLKLNYFLLN